MKFGSSRIWLQQVSCSRPDPVDEWLQAALALRIEIFWNDPLEPLRRSRKARLSRRIDQGGTKASPGCRAPRPHRVTMVATGSAKAGATHGRCGGPGSPRLTQLAEPSGAEDG